MSIIENEVIDSVICGRDTNDVVLLITDHMDWSNIQEHLLLLQTKLNTYISFIESGQLTTDFPISVNKRTKILVAGAHPLVHEANVFYEKADNYLRNQISAELLFVHENSEST